MQLVYVTYPDMKTAKRIAKALLVKRLAACATFFPVGSMYWWQGKIEHVREVASFIKNFSTIHNSKESLNSTSHSRSSRSA